MTLQSDRENYVRIRGLMQECKTKSEYTDVWNGNFETIDKLPVKGQLELKKYEPAA